MPWKSQSWLGGVRIASIWSYDHTTFAWLLRSAAGRRTSFEVSLQSNTADIFLNALEPVGDGSEGSLRVRSHLVCGSISLILVRQRAPHSKPLQFPYNDHCIAMQDRAAEKAVNKPCGAVSDCLDSLYSSE